jgi:hypothetical protein
VGEGLDSAISWRQLQVGGWDGVTLAWLGTELNADEAMEAGKRLVGEIEWARMRVLYPERFEEEGQ